MDWIKCSDRMPKFYEPVLVVFRGDHSEKPFLCELRPDDSPYACLRWSSLTYIQDSAAGVDVNEAVCWRPVYSTDSLIWPSDDMLNDTKFHAELPNISVVRKCDFCDRTFPCQDVFRVTTQDICMIEDVFCCKDCNEEGYPDDWLDDLRNEVRDYEKKEKEFRRRVCRDMGTKKATHRIMAQWAELHPNEYIPYYLQRHVVFHQCFIRNKLIRQATVSNGKIC